MPTTRRQVDVDAVGGSSEISSSSMWFNLLGRQIDEHLKFNSCAK